MLKEYIQFKVITISLDSYICLGTPLHVRLFCNNFPKINALSKKKIN